MDNVNGKISGEETEKVDHNSYQLTEDQWKLLEEAEAEYEGNEFVSGKKADRIVKVWLKSMNFSHS